MQSRKPLLVAALWLSPAFAGTANAASLDVQVTNLRPTTTVRVSIFNNAQSWVQGRKPVMVGEFAARQLSQTFHLDGLAPGRYAIRVDQQANPGGICEPPTFAVERHGHSGGESHVGAPTFERAAVEVGTE